MAKKTSSAKPAKTPTVPKKIFFYRVSIGQDDDGDLIPFPTKKVLTAVEELSFTGIGAGTRYLRIEDGVYLSGWVEPQKDRIILANVRRAGLPRLDMNGKLGPLKLPSGAGLAETVHVRFFKN